MSDAPCFFEDPSEVLEHYGNLTIRKNAFEIASGHILAAPLEHRRYVKLEDITSAARYFHHFGYLGWMNIEGTGATHTSHVHFQGLKLEGWLLEAPIMSATRRLLLQLSDGTRVSEVVEYPSPGIAIEGTNASAIAQQVLWALEETLFNLIFVRSEILILPRRVECPSGFGDKRFAGLEMAGVLVLEEESERFENLCGDDCANAIAECGISASHFAEFRRKILPSKLPVCQPH